MMDNDVKHKHHHHHTEEEEQQQQEEEELELELEEEKEEEREEEFVEQWVGCNAKKQSYVCGLHFMKYRSWSLFLYAR